MLAPPGDIVYFVVLNHQISEHRHYSKRALSLLTTRILYDASSIHINAGTTRRHDP